MKSILKTIGIIILSVIAFVFIVISLYFAILTIKEYKPEEVTSLAVTNNNTKTVEVENPISLLLYNLGFAAYVQDFSFFFDGGTESKTFSKETSEKVFDNTAKLINKLDPDFLLLQEIDKNTPRGGNFDQDKYLSNLISKDYNSSFALNYYVPFLFIPISDMTGRIEAGLVSKSKYSVYDATRISLPVDESWPVRLGSLKRCILVQRLKCNNGKDLVIINGHLSAYDKGGVYRKKQLMVIQDLLEKEEQKGNYVIMGADWNHIYPEIKNDTFSDNLVEGYDNFPTFFKPEKFKAVADITTPTNRSAKYPYKKGETYTTILDWYYVSDNIEVEEIKTIDLDFKDSDHQPVYLKVKLK